RHRLRDEISARRFRDWEDYCQEIVAILAAKNAQIEAARNTLDVALHTALRSPHPTDVTVDDQRVTTIDVAPDTRFVTIDQDDSPHGQYTIFRFTGSARTIPDWDSEITTRALCADVWGITDANAAQVLINRARELKFAALLPREVVEDPNQTSLDAALTSRAAQIVLKDRQRADIAANERLFQRALRYWKNTALLEEPTLAVVISTYNRALFVEANVSWLVRAAKTLGDIRIVVVDNASTDDTVSRLEKFIIEPCFSLIVNSQNVGMLGNLRVCSTLFAARHIWLTGDDDFIVPEQLSAILKILRDDPGLPLICMNFAVYLRERLLPSDSVKMIISEGSEIAGRKLKSGIYPVNVVVTQHDNLFTAIYPIIFRSDLLAACFNYPFDGKPFETLTECVPTTKWFLENFRFADCYWHAPVSVVGNAYNSWSHHRPRWHGVIMPQVFELARDAGADATILHQFAQLHIDLYDDALEIARRTRTPVSISAADLAPARRVFRQELALP
ncbi:MAG: glycosyltransferase, partial [Blastocatellia bacterium]|nr:glycosyltransferase [Blastocatellia bacterium]